MNTDDTPDDGLAIVTLVVFVLLLPVLGGLAWLAKLVFA